MNKKNILIFTIIAIIVIVIVIKNNLQNEDDYELNYENFLVSSDNEVQKTEEKMENQDNLIKIHITGEVNNQGVIELKAGDRIIDAIEKAGGLTDLADTSKVNLAYSLSDGEKIYIPSINDEEGISFIETENKNSKININTATLEELDSLSGIGESIAQSIIDYREENGKFQTIEDLKNVSGIGEAKFEKIKENITVK